MRHEVLRTAPNASRDILVTKLATVPQFYRPGAASCDPLGVLRELDAQIATRYGVKHCRVIGWDLNLEYHNHRAPTILTSEDEFIVDLNPRELPA